MLQVMFIAIGVASMALAIVLWGYLLVQARLEALGLDEITASAADHAKIGRNASMVASSACIAGHFFCLLALHVKI